MFVVTVVQHPQLCTEDEVAELDMIILCDLIACHLYVSQSVSAPATHSHARIMHITSTGTTAPHVTSSTTHVSSTASEELLAKIECLNACCQSL